MLSSQLDEQSKKWVQLKKEDLPKVSELIKQANLPALIIAEKSNASLWLACQLSQARTHALP
jgi:hypothetical protein